jgi:hypothetical protein
MATATVAPKPAKQPKPLPAKIVTSMRFMKP